MLCWTKFNLLSQLLIVLVSHSTFRTNTMISLSLPPIYLLMELIVEIDLILNFFTFSIITFSIVQFSTLASFVLT